MYILTAIIFRIKSQDSYVIKIIAKTNFLFHFPGKYGEFLKVYLVYLGRVFNFGDHFTNLFTFKVLLSK